MSYENLESPPIPHKYVPRRSVYGGEIVLQQPAEEVLIVQRTVWSRVVALVLVAVIGTFSFLFLYWFYQPLRFEEFRITDEKWLAVALASGGLLFSLALAADTLLKGPIRFDRVQRTVERGGWFPGWWHRDLADIVAVQFCQGKSDVTHGDRARDTKITPQYQINLVFRDSPPTRRNVSEQEHRFRAERIGQQIADFLNVPLLNYVGPAGTMDAADAKARRLLS